MRPGIPGLMLGVDPQAVDGLQQAGLFGKQQAQRLLRCERKRSGARRGVGLGVMWCVQGGSQPYKLGFRV